jgi:hypothetical protein
VVQELKKKRIRVVDWKLAGRDLGGPEVVLIAEGWEPLAKAV